MKQNFYISVMGTMGSGKTTVAKLISKRLGYRLLGESFGENVFLSRFYADMHRWAFHSQTFFLMEKVEQMLEIPDFLQTTSVVQDASIQQYVFSYAQALYKQGDMEEAEWQLYLKIYSSFATVMRHPDLIVYLETSFSELVHRIQARNRGFERTIPLEYLKLLDDLDHEWIRGNSTIPVLIINTDHLNIVSDPKAKKILLGKIQAHINQ